MKAISLWQPWATAMAIGLKSIETRHWSTNVRGLIAIHAAKQWQLPEREWAAELAELHDAPAIANPPLGRLVAVGKLVAVKRTEDLISTISDAEKTFGNYEPRRFGWIFQDIVALPAPIPFRGAQGFFDVPDDIVKLTISREPVIDLPPEQRDLFTAKP